MNLREPLWGAWGALRGGGMVEARHLLALLLLQQQSAGWSRLQRVTSEVGSEINQAGAALEQARPALRGWFAAVDFNSAYALGERGRRDRLLRRVIRQLSALPAPLAAPALWEASDALLQQLLPHHSSQGELRALLLRLAAPLPGMRVCDPACGVGGLLVGCAQAAAPLLLHGQERDAQAALLARAQLQLAGVLAARVEVGDTLRRPRLVSEEGGLLAYDRVLSAPPLLHRDWGVEEAKEDPHGRFARGVPPRHQGDLAFAQHALATLRSGGVAVLRLSLGALFRGGREGALRARLLQEDRVDAALALPPGLGDPDPAAVLVLRNDKPAARRGRVLLGQARAPVDAERLAQAYHAFAELPGLTRVLDLAALRRHAGSLAPRLHLGGPDDNDEDLAAAYPLEVPALLQELGQVEAQRDSIAQRMDRLLAALGGLVDPAAARELRPRYGDATAPAALTRYRSVPWGLGRSGPSAVSATC